MNDQETVEAAREAYARGDYVTSEELLAEIAERETR